MYNITLYVTEMQHSDSVFKGYSLWSIHTIVYSLLWNIAYIPYAI